MNSVRFILCPAGFSLWRKGKQGTIKIAGVIIGLVLTMLIFQPFMAGDAFGICELPSRLIRPGDDAGTAEALKRFAGNPGRADEDKACAFYHLAVLYHHKAGCYEEAERLYRDVIAGSTSVQIRLRDAAKTALSEIISLKNKYAEQDRVLLKIEKRFDLLKDKKQIEAALLYLEAIKENDQAYYRNHEIEYYSGVLWMRINGFGNALECFRKALHMKPACGLYLDIRQSKLQAKEAHVSSSIRTLAGVGLGLVIFASMAVFLISRPRRWLKKNHLGWLGLFLAGWYFLVSIGYEPMAGYLGGAAADAVIRYGITAFIVFMVFFAGIRRLVPRFAAIVLIYLYSVLLTISYASFFFIYYR